MIRRPSDFFLFFLRSGTIRRRFAYSLAVVRLILVPVIFLAIYYLFEMGRIVDRIVNVDAPAATLAQQASIEMLEARRAERSFFLLHDPAALQTVDQSTKSVEATLNRIQSLEPDEKEQIEHTREAAVLYANRFHTAFANADKNDVPPQIQAVVQDYEKSLNNLMNQEKKLGRAQLIDALRTRAESFDDQITKTIQARDPGLQKVTEDLQTSSGEVLQMLSSIEEQNWNSVQKDHGQARQLWHRAEWTLSIVSGLTFILSVWISFVLPRQLVEPLVSLKNEVDHAISGVYKTESHPSLEGELGQLARSIRKLISNWRTARTRPKL